MVGHFDYLGSILQPSGCFIGDVVAGNIVGLGRNCGEYGNRLWRGLAIMTHP